MDEIIIPDKKLAPGELGEDTLLSLTVMKIHSKEGKPHALDICMRIIATNLAEVFKANDNLLVPPDLRSKKTLVINPNFDQDIRNYVKKYSENSLANKYILHVPYSIEIDALTEVVEEVNSEKCQKAFHEVG